MSFFVRDLQEIQKLNHIVDDWNPGITTKPRNLRKGHQPQQYFHFPSDIAVPSCPILSQRFPFPTGTGHTYRELGFWLGILHGGYACRSQLMRKSTKTTWWFGRKAAARKKPWAHFGWRWVWKVLPVSRFLCNTFSLRSWVMRDWDCYLRDRSSKLLPRIRFKEHSKLQLCFRRLLSSGKASSLVWSCEGFFAALVRVNGCVCRGVGCLFSRHSVRRRCSSYQIITASLV